MFRMDTLFAQLLYPEDFALRARARTCSSLVGPLGMCKNVAIYENLARLLHQGTESNFVLSN